MGLKMMEQHVDVIIVGAGFAGLSAALFVGNARRQAILVDGGQTRNWDAQHAHNVLGAENKNPRDLLQQAWHEISALPTVTYINTLASEIVNENNNSFLVTLDNGLQYRSRILVLATGLVDLLPDIDGVDAFWPQNLFHCPYCIAPELVNEPLGVICETEEAFFLSSIVHKWSKDLILFTNNSQSLSEEEKVKLESRSIPIISDLITKFSGTPGHNINIHFDRQDMVSRRGVFMHLPVKQRAENLLKQLNLAVNEEALVNVDATFQTDIPGVYAIGDMSQMVQKVTTAIASGTCAGFEIDHQLTEIEMAR